MNEIDEKTIAQLKKHQGENWGSGTIIVNKQGQILIGVRTDTRTWGTPGGKVDNNETVLEGAIREVKEECNLDVKNLKCYGVHVGAYNNGGSGNEEKMWLSFLFITHDFSGEVKAQPSEISGFVWMYPKEIKKLDLFGPSKTGFEEAIKKDLINGKDMKEDRLYIVVYELANKRVVHYISVLDSIGRFRLVNLNAYKLEPGTWETIKDIRQYFIDQERERKIIIDFDKDLLKFT